MEFWLDKFPDVKTVVIINITEKPAYHRPKSPTKDQLDDILQNWKMGSRHVRL